MSEVSEWTHELDGWTTRCAEQTASRPAAELPGWANYLRPGTDSPPIRYAKNVGTHRAPIFHLEGRAKPSMQIGFHFGRLRYECSSNLFDFRFKIEITASVCA